MKRAPGPKGYQVIGSISTLLGVFIQNLPVLLSMETS